MPRKVTESDRARSVSLSLKAPQIFILEKLAERRMRDGNLDEAEAYREAIMQAGAQADIFPFTYSSIGEIFTHEYQQWLEARGWSEDFVGKPPEYKGLYASLKTHPRTRRSKVNGKRR
jgi:hypothetical protein